MLLELLRADGGVVSTEQLLEKAWDEQIDPFTNVVRFTIMKLRRKLGEPALIETLPGSGYRHSMKLSSGKWHSTIRLRLTLLYASGIFPRRPRVHRL